MNIDISKIKTTHWSELFLQINANSDCYDYARSISYQEFWDNSPRGDWLIYFAAKEGSVPRKLIVKAACQCVRLSLPYVKQDELRPFQAIETTELWLEDKATIEEVKLAVDAAYSANAADSASYAAYYAAAVAAATAYAADSASYAADSASYAAYYAAAVAAATAYAPADYAAYAAYAVKKEMQQKAADIVRSIIPMPTEAVKQFERLVSMKAFW